MNAGLLSCRRSRETRSTWHYLRPVLSTERISGIANHQFEHDSHVARNFTKLQGSHNLKFGTDVRLGGAFGNRFPEQVAPAFNFQTTYTRGPLDNSPAAQVGQELASMLLGVPADR